MKKFSMRRRTLAALFALACVFAALLLPVTGQAAGAPAIAFAPSSWDYGTIDSGTTASKTFTLTNSGGKATSALKVVLTGSSAFTVTADTCTATALGPKKSCSVTVQYAPTTAGSSDSATLTASSKKPAANASASLTGSGAAANLVLGLPAESTGTAGATNLYEYDLGSVEPGDVDTQSFVMTNTGTGSTATLFLNCDASHAPCSGPHLTLANDTCTGTPLAPGGTCSFEVTATVQSPCFKGFLGSVAVEGNGAYLILRIGGSCFEF